MDRKIIIAKAFDVLERELDIKRETWIELLTRKERFNVFTGQAEQIHGTDNLDEIDSPMIVNKIWTVVRREYLKLGYNWDVLDHDQIVRKYTQKELDEMKRIREENRVKNSTPSRWNNSAYMTYGT